MSQPVLIGKNTTWTFLLGGNDAKAKNVAVRPQNGSIKPEMVQVEDDVCGASRTEVTQVLKFYSVSLVSSIKDLKLLRALLEYQRQLDLEVALAESAVGITIKPNNGTREAFQLRGYVLGAWDLNLAGRTEKQIITIPGTATHFEPLAVGP